MHLQHAPLLIKLRIFLLLTSLVIPNLFSAAYASSNFHNLSFSFPSFNSNNHEVQCEGDASLSSSGLSLTINRADAPLNYSVGRAVYHNPMHLWDNSTGKTADFSTRFSFSINSVKKTTPPYADGFAFFLVPNGSTIPNNSFGGYLGLVTNTYDNSSDTGNFVAVEFDTFWNPSWDPGSSYSDAAHIGIDVNSVKSVTFQWWTWGNEKKISGGNCEASIMYNSSSHNLSVLLADDLGNSSNLSYQIPLENYLPEWITFGFSATTGSNFELHTIYSWEFNASLKIADSTETNQTISNPPATNAQKKPPSRLWVILGLLCAFILLGTIAVVVWFFRQKVLSGTDWSSLPLFPDGYLSNWDKLVQKIR